MVRKKRTADEAADHEATNKAEAGPEKKRRKVEQSESSKGVGASSKQGIGVYE